MKKSKIARGEGDPVQRLAFDAVAGRGLGFTGSQAGAQAGADIQGEPEVAEEVAEEDEILGEICSIQFVHVVPIFNIQDTAYSLDTSPRPS